MGKEKNKKERKKERGGLRTVKDKTIEGSEKHRWSLRNINQSMTQ